jgi:hypothetical protein
MKKTATSCAPKKGSTGGAEGARVGNKGGKGSDMGRMAKASGGLCSGDWTASQGPGSKPGKR